MFGLSACLSIGQSGQDRSLSQSINQSGPVCRSVDRSVYLCACLRASVCLNLSATYCRECAGYEASDGCKSQTRCPRYDLEPSNKLARTLLSYELKRSKRDWPSEGEEMRCLRRHPRLTGLHSARRTRASTNLYGFPREFVVSQQFDGCCREKLFQRSYRTQNYALRIIELFLV